MKPSPPTRSRAHLHFSPKAKANDLPGELRLLIAEVAQYLEQVRSYLADHSVSTPEELRHKLAYISTLALKARNQNFDLERYGVDESHFRFFHGLSTVTTLLARVAELALNMVRQTEHFICPYFLDTYGLEDFFEDIDQGLALIRPAVEQRKMNLVVRLCLVEEKLDAHYANRVARLIKELEQGCGHPSDQVTGLMVVHYLERIGDTLLEIGEEILHIFLGENLSFSQYQALSGIFRRVWGRSGQDLIDPGGFFHSIWSGRSGCRVGLVYPEGYQQEDSDSEAKIETRVIFKHGPVTKLEREKANLVTWGGLWPGLPPSVRDFVTAENGTEATLVMEYIPGHTLKNIFQNPSDPKAMYELTGALNLMGSIWRETRKEEPTWSGFARQAEKRLGPVQALYPELVNFNGWVGGLEIKSFEVLLKEASILEKNIPAPFTVRIHGDFNLSNIMRDQLQNRYRFIDFYRSRHSDYAQDLSVMILSILRLPLRGVAEREDLSKAARQVWTFAKGFATAQNDPTLEARLTFGLARSYLTSARFEPRRTMGTRFIGYSRYLWEKLIAHGHSGRPWSDFRLDPRILYI